jgi:hypothetical protein
MEQVTTTELKQLKEKSGDNKGAHEDAFIDLDFATEDFIFKNIRVRPISGVTHGDETKDGRASNISKGNQPEEAEDPSDNHNKLALYDMDKQRKDAKKKRNEYLEELKRKQALEEKKA